jgi:group I intron endonuclease
MDSGFMYQEKNMNTHIPTKDDLSRPGIYVITNRLGAKKYVGQSINIFTRWNNHKKLLRSGIHYNPHLQNAWNKYGDRNFCFEVLEFCFPENLNDKEQYWISRLNPEYNIVRNVFAFSEGLGNAPINSDLDFVRRSEFMKLTKEMLTKGKPMEEITIRSYKQMPTGTISRGFTLATNEEVEAFANRLEKEKGNTITVIYHNPKTKTVYVPSPSKPKPTVFSADL